MNMANLSSTGPEQNAAGRRLLASERRAAVLKIRNSIQSRSRDLWYQC